VTLQKIFGKEISPGAENKEVVVQLGETAPNEANPEKAVEI